MISVYSDGTDVSTLLSQVKNKSSEVLRNITQGLSMKKIKKSYLILSGP